MSRDPSFWNTLVYRSDQVTIQNYKVDQLSAEDGRYNQTDGIDFVESNERPAQQRFLYTGDDGMAPKNEAPAVTST